MNGEKLPSARIRFVSKSKEIVPVEINSKKINYDGKDAILVVVRDISDRKEMEKKIMNAIIDTEEKERQRFAEEIHDGLGPLISSMKLSLQYLYEKAGNDENRHVFENFDEVLHEAIRSLKEIANQLSPHVLKNFGLFSALNSFCLKVSDSGSISIKINSRIDDLRMNLQLELVLYRMLTELINNTLKHAEAKNAAITLDTEDDLLVISYFDDGKGFNPDERINVPDSGHGLLNIKSRLDTFNGDIKIDTKEGAGFKAEIRIKIIT